MAMGQRTLPALREPAMLTCPLCGQQVPVPATVGRAKLSALRQRSPEVVTAFAYVVLGHECSRPLVSRAFPPRVLSR